MKKVALHNLGCKVNSYEIEVMQQRLQEKGYEIVSFAQFADIYIVNTCSVTNIADRKSRQMLHRAKQINPNAVVVAVGCYVQTGRENIEQDDGVDLAIGNNRKKDIVEILEEYLKRREQAAESRAADAPEENGAMDVSGVETEQKADGLRKDGWQAICAEDKTLDGTTIIDINHTDEYEEMQLKQTAEHTRAYIKIQDGCNQFCSYCVIPYARGRVRSRREEDILAEVRALAEKGYREIVLTGIHISSYGLEKGTVYSGESRLIELVERLHEVEGIDRIRLGSLEPRIVTDDAAKRLAALSKVCPHFHLSLQSGCDETLRRMNRRYTTGEYYDSVEHLRKAFGNPAITTDVIVGFPGETEEEFAQTKAFLEKVGFYEMHIFKYSKRAGTVAAKMPNQVPEQVKAARSNELLQLEKEQSKEFRAQYIGREVSILPEEVKHIAGADYLLGHTADYVKVALPVEKRISSAQDAVTTGQDMVSVGSFGEEMGFGTILDVRVSDFLTDEIMLAALWK